MDSGDLDFVAQFLKFDSSLRMVIARCAIAAKDMNSSYQTTLHMLMAASSERWGATAEEKLVAEALRRCGVDRNAAVSWITENGSMETPIADSVVGKAGEKLLPMSIELRDTMVRVNQTIVELVTELLAASTPTDAAKFAASIQLTPESFGSRLGEIDE